MQLGLLGALVAAVAYGVATILQTVGVRRAERAERLDPRLLWRLIRSLPYVVGLALDGLGFLLSLAALRSLPLFVVQAAISASLAVTALLAALLLRARLRALEWAAIGVVSAGLALLAIASGPQHPAHVHFFGRCALLVGVVGLAAVAALATQGTSRPEPCQRPGRPVAVPGDPPGTDRAPGHGAGVWALGVLAGLAYGAAGIGARVLARPRSLAGLVTDPALWAIALAGLLGLLLYATALQRGSVTLATAGVTVAETLVPAAVGVVLLGDHPRHGLAALAAAGFGLTVAGALLLARYGEATPRKV